MAEDKKTNDSEIPNVKELLEYKTKVHCELCDLKNLDCCNTCIYTAIKQFIELFNRLQAENEQLTKDKENLAYSFANAVGQKITAKAEAYKEFAERLKREKATGMNFLGKEHYSVNIEEIDNLLNELVGEQPILNDVKCIDCEYLELELPYAVCSKAYKGIVAPDDSCGKGKLKELVGEDNI